MAVRECVYTVSEEDYHDGTVGICLSCGEQTYGVEPDARNYPCESCGENGVHGLEEALMMGRLDVACGDD